INEATQLYVLASGVLGRKQDTIPAYAKPVDKSFDSVKDSLDKFSNFKTEIEAYIGSSGNPDPDDNLRMFYFGIPKNDYMTKYWDTVADRLFKIRHCMNIEGLIQQLPLFEPPIDPALLVKATAAGLDLSSILTDTDSL